eukprot:Colp12_sorted_trinity150504_noHs@24006
MGKTSFNVVVLGYGLAGKSFHCYLVQLTKGLNLYGVYARSAQAQEQIKGDVPNAKVFGTLEDVLMDPNVDVVVVAVPNEFHASFAIQAMKAGKNVVVDKPFCLTPEELKDLLKTAEETKVMLSVFQNRRWDGDYLTVLDLLQQKKLGEARWIEVAWQKSGVSTKAWKANSSLEKGGGTFLDLGAHMVDQLVTIFPHKITSVHARMH